MNLYNLGMPAEQISREINCGISVLKNLLRKEGIPFGVNKPRYFIFDLYGNLIEDETIGHFFVYDENNICLSNSDMI